MTELPAPQLHRRLRVLYLIDNLGNNGGAERFALGLAANMPRERIEAWVCSTRIAEQAEVRLLADAGIPHLNLGRKAKWDVHRLGALAGLLRRERFDVLHSHMFGSNLWGTIFGRACRVPVTIAHEHNWSYEDDRLRLWLDGHVIGVLATRMVAVSESNRRLMVTREGIPPDKVVVLPTAYIPSGPSSGGDRADIRVELGLPADASIIAVAAWLRKEKALDVLVQAHAQVRRQVPDAHLVIAGGGEGRPELERQVAKLGLGSCVHLLGLRSDVDSLLSHADVGAMSSDWEGMPLFVLECAVAGVPLVATRVGGIPEIVEHGQTGLLVPRRHPDALAEAIVSLLRDPALRRKLGQAAGASLGHLTIDRIANQFADLYEELAATA